MNDKSLAPALSRGLKILELISENGGMGFNELMRTLCISATSLNRLLKVLLDEGYIVRDPGSRYVRGVKCLLLGRGGVSYQTLLGHSGVILRELSDTFKVSCLLIVFEDYKMVCIDKVACPDNVVLQEVGTVDTNYPNNPWGFLFLASLPLQERMLLLSSIQASLPQAHNNPSPQMLEKLIEDTRQNGYGDDLSSIILNVRRFAVPIYDSGHRLIAALGVGSIEGLLDENKTASMIEKMRQKAHALSKIIQGQ